MKLIRLVPCIAFCVGCARGPAGDVGQVSSPASVPAAKPASKSEAMATSDTTVAKTTLAKTTTKMTAGLQLQFVEADSVSPGTRMSVPLEIQGQPNALLQASIRLSEGELDAEQATVQLDDEGRGTLAIDITVPRATGCVLSVSLQVPDGRRQEAVCQIGGPDADDAAATTREIDGRAVRIDPGS